MSTQTETEFKHGKEAEGFTTITFPDGRTIEVEAVVLVARGVRSENGVPVIQQYDTVAAAGAFGVESLMEMQEAINDKMDEMGDKLLEALYAEHGEEEGTRAIASAMARIATRKIAEQILGPNVEDIEDIGKAYDELPQDKKDEMKKEMLRAGISDCTCEDCQRLRAEIEKEDNK